MTRFGFGERVESLEYSRDGKRLISSGSGWGTAVWDAVTGELIRHVPEEGAYLEASLSADGTLMATSSRNARTVQVRRVETGEVVCSIDGGFRAVRFAPDGKSVFTVVGNRVARFDVATGEQLPAFADVGGGSSTFAVAPTGTLVAGIASPRSMAVWDWKEQKEVARARSLRMGQGNARDIVFTPDGQSLVLLGEKNTGADLRDARTLEVTKEFPGDENNKSTCVSVSADGRRIAFGAEGGLVFVYDLETGELVNSWQAHTSHIAALALSPDGTRLACGTRRSGSVKIWNVETLKPVFSPDTREEAIAGRGTSEGHPPRMANDIVERLEQAGRFTRLLEAVDAADLEELLYFTGGLTLFAPTDEAFEALAPEGTLEALLEPENKDRLADLLRYHFVNGALTTKDLASTSFEAANGKSIDVVDREGVLSLNESRITGSEIVCSNGIVHVIDAVLLPPDVRAEVSPHWKNGKLSDPVSVYAIANKTIRTPVVQLAPNIEFKSDEFEFDINDYPQKSLRANTEILVGWPTNIELNYRPRDGYRGPLPEANLKHAVHWGFVDTEGQRHELAAGYGHTITIGGGKSGGVTLFSQQELTEGHFEITFYETLLTKARWRDEWRTPLTRSDLTLLQGDWETVSVTEGGKQLATQNGFGGLLLQIKGNTFAIAERKPNGEKSEADTGRMEINSTAAPKTIDFIGRAERRLGIYELKHGALRVCLVEQTGNDAPAQESIPDMKPVKRPTTFDAPVGSNIMLMEFQRKQPDVNNEQRTREFLDTSFISNDTVGLLVIHPQRLLGRKSKINEELDQMFAKVAESEGLDVRNLSQIVAQVGTPPLSRRPIRNLWDEELWTLVLRFDKPIDVESYIEKHARGYTETEHKRETYYKHDTRMAMWFPDNRTLLLAAERRILSFIDDPDGKGPMATRMGHADATNDLLLEIDVRQAGPLLLESLPAEANEPELHPDIEQTIQHLTSIAFSVKQNSDVPVRAQFQAIDAEAARGLHDKGSVLLGTAKRSWPKLRDLIRERPADKNTWLANALANEIDSLLPAIRLTVNEDQLLVRLEKEGGVDLAALLVFFKLID